MINYYDKHKFISKRELARLAGVSDRTLSRYLQTRRHILDAMGVLPHARLLPPQAVKYICEDYCIDLPQNLQDKEVIEKSPIYKNLVRELQTSTFFEDHWVRVTEIPFKKTYLSSCIVYAPSSAKHASGSHGSFHLRQRQ